VGFVIPPYYPNPFAMGYAMTFYIGVKELIFLKVREDYNSRKKKKNA
jgi:hypothetical protein